MNRPVSSRWLASAVSALAVAMLSVPSGLSAAEPDSASNAAETTGGDAQGWGDFGVQTQWIEPSIKPGDDFDEHVNGKWTATHEIPADKTRFGSFIALRDLSDERLHAMLDDLAATQHPAGSDEARIADSYRAFMDMDAINKAGLAPAQPWLDKIWAIKSRDDLLKVFGTPGFASPIDAGVGADEKQSDIYALYVSQGGLGLPDRDYYLKTDDRSKEIRAKYADYLTFVYGKLGYQDPAATAKAVLSLEMRLAQEQWDRAASRNRDLTYNKLSMAEFEALAPAGELKTFLDTAGAGAASYVIGVEMPPTAEELKTAKIDGNSAVAKFGGGIPATIRLINEVPISSWQAWLAGRFISGNSAYLPSDIDDANFAFYGTFLGGQPQQRARWKRGISAVEWQVGELLGKLYAEKYFPPAEKAAMTDLVANLRKAMAANLADLKWMGPETRKQALAKLDAFTPKIGAPVEYKAYEGLQISSSAPLANRMAASAWQNSYDMERLGKPVDRNEWHMFPQTVNAYYNPSMNEIVFPAAILQPPFFNLSADPAVNYGAIGAVIGHEMGHGFDDQGAKSDGQGNLRDWWTSQDKANFEKLQDKLGAQYDAFCPFDEGKTCVNGQLTMGENIGDVGGLSLAYRAYQLSLGGKPAPVIDGYTGDQRFFMAWAQVWRSKTREKQLRQYLITDPHSPDHYRVNGVVRNFDEWYKAFDVKPGEALYLPPSERVRIW